MERWMLGAAWFISAVVYVLNATREADDPFGERWYVLANLAMGGVSLAALVWVLS